VEARLILCTLRHFTEQQSLETVRLVERFKGTNVVAIDLAGDEAGFPISPHVSAYAFAVEKQLSRTAHAGEAAGAESVWETLRLLQPTRIGHGVRSTEDQKLLEYLREQKIHLEVCPSSNLQTNVYEELRTHALDRLYRGGVSVSINTDARTITDITLEEEYDKVRREFGWKDKDFLRCNLMALAAAFVPEALRKQLALQLVKRSR